MISRLRALTDRIDAYHAELHQVEEDVDELMTRRDALVTQLTDLGILVSVARKLVARVELVVGWPEVAKETSLVKQFPPTMLLDGSTVPMPDPDTDRRALDVPEVLRREAKP